MGRDDLRSIGLALAARLLGRPPVPAVPPRRLLLIRPDHLGDLLLTTPALAALRAALPHAHLTLMVGPWSAEVARRGAAFDELLVCDFPGFTRRSKPHPLQPYTLLLREARRLRGRFDLAVVLRPDHWWGALLAAAAGIPRRLGFATRLTAPLLTDALPLPSGVHASQLSVLLAARAAELAGGGPIDTARSVRPIFRLSAEERAWAERLTTRVTQPLVLLHPGSGSPLKNWPARRWAVVADALAERGATVVLTGGPDDLDSPRAVAAAMTAQPLLLAGQTNLGQLGALGERCALALGPDNGPLHLAAALGAPTLRLYGPTDPALFGPCGPSTHAVLTHDLPCRPCGNLEAPPCGARQEPPCLLGIQTGAVIEAALKLLAAQPAPPRPD